ncbi:MAG: DUF6625 family protein [Propylenella sp.]
MQKPLILFAQWFGPWPEWIEFFVESCKWNRDIDWLIFTDQVAPENQAPNLRYEKVSFEDHKARISAAIGLDLSHASPLKLCDLKPTLGHVFTSETEGYRNYGHCDLDLIFGDIRSFYTDALLEKYEVLSTHDDRISGHLVVLRNNAFNKSAFGRIKGWRRKAMDPHTHSIDEYRFGNVFTRPSLWRRLTERRVPVLFEERYTTPLTRKPWLDGTSNYPTHWFWQNGRLSAEGCEHREFIYIHFMNWKSTTSHTVRGGYSTAPWSKLNRIVSTDWRKAGTEGFVISHDGIGPLLGDRTGGLHRDSVPPA